MQRISEPQIVEALTSISTSPWRGTGTGTLRNSTVLLPGRKAAFMLACICLTRFPAGAAPIAPGPPSSGSDLPVEVPEVFPRLAVLPEEHLTLDQSAIAIHRPNGLHVLRGQRLTEHGLQVGQDVARV